ncbi:MAG: FimB/Mfa2 family fimbrial subunit [Parabacteroides sp.]|nr:FimB/Mfa2 family fimbrial subunit [Parabacteroides sp.]
MANADADALPQQTTPADLAQWLKDHADSFPDLLTASAQTEIGTGEINRLLLTLKAGTDGLALSAVRLLLTVPETKMPDYSSTRAAAETPAGAWQLRCVAEVYRKGTDTRTHRRELLCERQADGRYAAELFLLPGDYDLRLWTDWNGDYYDTEDLTAVTVRTENYIAGTITDTKDAYYATATISVSESTEETAIELPRPFARYRLVATDVEGYNRLVEKEDYPPIENLEVRVGYEGFFPTGFDVATGKPNDALTGIFYTTVPVGADGFDKAEALQVGGDFVLTNGEESFVTSTVKIIDRTTGETVSRTAGVKIPYRRGHLTTVTGHFLTAGKTTGGVQIDTGWEDEIIVEF